jgi:leucyl-tRNA---protein transferase
MFAQARFPSELISPEELDLYLSKGWFRMGHYIFTCTYIQLTGQVYRVHWLRVVLDHFEKDKTFLKLEKLNSKFSIKIQKASITPEKEELFSAYKTAVTFQTHESLEVLLKNGSDLEIFNTLELDIYDGEKLIAVGFFDVGYNSAAGICSFYDPAYKKYSLGKYLIYQKMMYCKNQQFQYFYPGYFAKGCRAFDYKLEIGKKGLEYFDSSDMQWNAIHVWDSEKGSIEENRQKLIALQQELTNVNIENRLFRYSYFQANLFRELQGYELFDYLMFVNCFPYDPEVVNPIVVYDFRNQHYQLLRCISVGKPEASAGEEDEYTAHVLKITGIIYSTPDEKEMADVMVRAFTVIRDRNGITEAQNSDVNQ